MRLGGKRRRDGGFQWLIIGIVLGMGCAFSFGLALYVFEVIEISGSDEQPTDIPEVRIITPTSDVTAETGTTLETTPDASTVDTTATEDTGNSQTSIPTESTPLPQSAETVATTPADTVAITPLPGGPTTTPTIGIVVNSGNTVQDSQGTGGQAVPTQDTGALPPAVSLPLELTAVLTPLVNVAGGTFKMGTTRDEGLAAVAECITRDTGTCDEPMILDAVPPHDVTLTDYYIEKYEVSVSQYVAFLNYLLDQNPSNTRPHLTACSGGPCALTISDNGGENSDIAFDGTRYSIRAAAIDRSNYPVTFVYWAGAKTYCETVGRYLPSEAQWERAARGINNWIYPWGQQWNASFANTSRSGTQGVGTEEVTRYAEGASSWGAVNMAGNVAEWTADSYMENLYNQRSSTGAPVVNPVSQGGATISVRGGAWDTIPLFVRTVHRMAIASNAPNASLGFRCASDTP